MGTQLTIEKHGTKPNGDPFWSGTEWEHLDAIRGFEENATGLPIVYLYRHTDSPILPEDPTDTNTLREYADQLDRVRAFFAQFRDEATGAFLSNVHKYEHPDGFQSQFEKHMELIIQSVVELKQRDRIKWLDQGDKSLSFDPGFTGSPYPGLRTF